MANLFIDESYASYSYNSAKNREKLANNVSAVAGLAGVGAIGYGINSLAKSKPIAAGRIYVKADEFVGKGGEVAYKYGKKVIDFINKNKYAKKITDKISDLFMKGAKKVAKTDTGKNILTKSIDKLAKFCDLSSIKRGKYMLLTAGATLLAGTAIHIIRQHDKNDGKIDQKYNDINRLSQIL
jgi:hypothetical protein